MSKLDINIDFSGLDASDFSDQCEQVILFSRVLIDEIKRKATSPEIHDEYLADLTAKAIAAVLNYKTQKGAKEPKPGQIRDFLAGLMLPDGPCHGGKPLRIGWYDESLWAPLLHVYAQNPAEMAGVQGPLFDHLAWKYIGMSKKAAAKTITEFESVMDAISRRAGKVDYKPLVAEIMQNFDSHVFNYTKLPDLYKAGGVDALIAWGADVSKVCDKGMIDLDACMARSGMYADISKMALSLFAHLERAGTMSTAEADRRRGVLLVAGLEASGRLKNKSDTSQWQSLINQVIGYRNQPLTPRQMISYIRFEADEAKRLEVLGELRAIGSKNVVKAIKTDYHQVAQAEQIRALGVTDGISSNELIRLTGDAFSYDLGL